MKVLVIEDEEDLNKIVKEFLELRNYEVVSVLDGNEAINYIDDNYFDIYIIDINIPHINGLDLVKYIRKKDIISPIIIITALFEIDKFVEAFDNGCNDYIKKPFHLKELEVRMANLLNHQNSYILQVNDRISYNFKYEELMIDGKVVHLRKKVNRLLQILLKNLNHTVKTEDIINYVWENEIRDTYPLRQLINDLRKEFNLGKNYIISEKGIGYKFET